MYQQLIKYSDFLVLSTLPFSLYDILAALNKQPNKTERQMF
jgi:hypothetical protein